ncbi:hypothetical protein RND71_022136 [Anisodus tanguticus]|uniref:Uncharacterized protein n=1 Tax=Anisodus tanguticus TaxID=243964 RepID=A0AAE1RYC2_9SOLA|nr:hypothetical protein RND71_022136 [Anisodus tanguticus]
MYHPTRGGVRGGRDQIRRIKEEEQQAMREALCLAIKRATRPQGHSEAARVDGLGFSKKYCSLWIFVVLSGHFISPVVHYAHYFSLPFSFFLTNKSSISLLVAEQGLDFEDERLPKPWEEQPSSPLAFPSNQIDEPVEKINASLPAAAPIQNEEESDEKSQKKKRREEKRQGKDERREKRHLQDTDDRRKHSRDSDGRRKCSRDSDDKRKHTRDSDDRRKHKKDEEKRRRHDSDSD